MNITYYSVHYQPRHITPTLAKWDRPINQAWTDHTVGSSPQSLSWTGWTASLPAIVPHLLLTGRPPLSRIMPQRLSKRPGELGEPPQDSIPGASKVKLPRLERGPEDFSQVVKDKLQSYTRTGQACDRCKVRRRYCHCSLILFHFKSCKISAGGLEMGGQESDSYLPSC